MALPAPAAATELWGHEKAEAALLQLALSGRMPHGWIFVGPSGVGKATLAYRLARFLLYRGTGTGAAPQNFDMLLERVGAGDVTPKSLAIPPESPAFAQVAAASHPDLLAIALEEDKRDISVEQIRTVPEFLSKTASQGGWRIVIVDGAERMNRAAQNALLKVLEEPSPNSVLILLADNVGGLLPTIRSRCRLLRLDADGMDLGALRGQLDALSSADQKLLFDMAGGAPGQVLQLLEKDAITTLSHLLDYARQPSAENADALARGWAYQPQFDLSGRVWLWWLQQLAVGRDFGLPPARVPAALLLHQDSQTMLAETRQLNLDGGACWHTLLSRIHEVF